MLGHRGDRRAGIGHEHRPGRFEDALVVAGRLGLAAAERAVAVRAVAVRTVAVRTVAVRTVAVRRPGLVSVMEKV